MALALIAPCVANAAEPEQGDAAPARAEITETELESWLASDPADADTGPVEAELEAAPLPPRRRGVVIEGSVGALGHVGDMQNISPIAPWFRLQGGYELFDWLMLFGESDLALANTSYASRPPNTRSYGLFGFGLGARLSWQPWTQVGFYLQGGGGLSSVTEDVLATYGYRDADRVRPYAGGSIGIEWYQISPHYALAVYGGVRDYLQNFERTNGEKPPLVWISGLALRYAL
jgi:hypothetical protein